MKTEQNRRHQFFDFVRTIIYALLIAGVVRTFLFEPFNIPSGSMLPTLLVGDYLFVSKYTYGYSTFSLPFSLDLFSGRIFGRAPDRGDVVVFKLPSDRQTDYIKRVIGLPGDTVQLKRGLLYINGEPVHRAPSPLFEGPGAGAPLRDWIETLPNGVAHSILELHDNQSEDETRLYTVPPGAIFAMGDNRDNSRDSRYPEVGFVPIENIVGKAQVIFFSIDQKPVPFWRFYERIRWSRIFDRVQ